MIDLSQILLLLDLFILILVYLIRFAGQKGCLIEVPILVIYIVLVTTEFLLVFINYLILSFRFINYQ